MHSSAGRPAARGGRPGAAERGERGHHVACRACGRTATISEPALRQWVTAAGGQGRTSLARLLFGRCPGCGRP